MKSQYGIDITEDIQAIAVSFCRLSEYEKNMNNVMSFKRPCRSGTFKTFEFINK